MRKIVICRPQGGFNDILCQVVKCYVYCCQFNRDLYVDTCFRGNQYFKESLGKYFVSRSDILKFDGTPRFYCGEKSVFPRTLSETGDEYEYEFDDLSRSYLLRHNNEPITFDFLSDYEERIIVHHSSGGGTESALFFAIAELRPFVLRAIEEDTAHIPQNAVGVHVRYTDYRSDYLEILQRLQDSKVKNVFLCSDSGLICEKFESYLTSANVYCFNSRKGGQPIHVIEHGISKEVINILNYAMLRDLLMLSRCSYIYIAPLNKNGEMSPDRYSGFSILALKLNILSKGFFRKLLENIAVNFKLSTPQSDPQFTTAELLKFLIKYSMLKVRRFL